MNGGNNGRCSVWEDAFITALKETGVRANDGRVNVTIACDCSRISRTMAYKRRRESSEFQRRWDEVVLLVEENERQRRTRRALLALRGLDIQ